MVFNNLEKFLIQFSFIIFFLTTLFSWFKITLYENKTICSTNNSQKIFSFSNPYGSFIGILLGFISITGLCLIRWNLSDHLPLSNLYESSLFLAWSLIFFYLIFKIKIHNEWLDAIIAPIILMTTTFSTLGLPKQLQESTALVPALQSNWLMMHVTMMILSYGALLFGSLLAVTLLTLTFFSINKNNTFVPLWNLSSPDFDARQAIGISEIINDLETNKFFLNSIKNSEKINLNQLQETKVISNPSKAITSSHSITPNFHLEDGEFFKLIYFHKYKAVLINQIDYWSYRIIGIGFPFLTLGILSGAVWANEAWGSYWNWDPKETWALITWVIFAIYLHIRITKGWNGTKPALVALLGFFVVWMCYLGVNLLGKGLHSYGWLN
uniref:Cytochrome c biogenesis protein CcsA n=1 Tax=Staurastrum punctulatum TaxID=102822 RepID=Q32S10_STAPU|nr:cytochrome c biogenesis protein [Staurastrum punctulatum]AAX45688.1 protein involved in cytochrome c biogenesis [Staurastrum punctulatum]